LLDISEQSIRLVWDIEIDNIFYKNEPEPEPEVVE
jgi:hypothetical protein